MPLNEYAIVRMDKPVRGTAKRPAADPLRCRYYIFAPKEAAAKEEAARRWPGERVEIVGTRKNVQPHFKTA